MKVGKYYDRYENNYQLNYGHYHVIVYYDSKEEEDIKREDNIMEEFTFIHQERETPDDLDYIELQHEDYGHSKHNAGYVLRYKRSISTDDILEVASNSRWDTREEIIGFLKYRLNQVASNHILQGRVPFKNIDLDDERRIDIEKL